MMKIDFQIPKTAAHFALRIDPKLQFILSRLTFVAKVCFLAFSFLYITHRLICFVAKKLTPASPRITHDETVFATAALRNNRATISPVAVTIDTDDSATTHQLVRRAIQRGMEPLNLNYNHLTPRIFCNLIDEFPSRKQLIGNIACKWAKQRSIQYDPNHPYSAIFRDLFALKNQIDGNRNFGTDLSSLSRYTPPKNSASFDQFQQIVDTLIGFQELSRPENLELINKLDDPIFAFNYNKPAFRYAEELSKIMTYSLEGELLRKIQIGIGAPWETYQIAKENNQLLRFFQVGFGYDVCFDARVNRLQAFHSTVLDNQAEDFNLKINKNDTLFQKIAECYRAFRNTMIRDYAKQINLTYNNLKALIADQPNHQTTIDFYSRILTRDRFAEYLQQKDYPVRLKAQTREEDPSITFSVNRKSEFMQIPLNKIPVHLRVSGSRFSVFDYMYFETFPAKIFKIEGNVATLDMRGDPMPREGDQGWESLLDQMGL